MQRSLAAVSTGSLAILGLLTLGPRIAAGIDPNAAARFAQWDNEVQRRAAFASLQAELPRQAAGFGRQALASMPFDQFSLGAATLHLPAERRLAALNVAAGLGWRDLPTNIALFEAGIRERRADIAAQRVDAIGRLAGGQAAAGFADRLLTVPDGLDQLGARARSLGGGGWWEAYLRSAPANREVAVKRVALAEAMLRDDASIRRRFVRNTEAGMISAGFAELAYGLWRGSLDENANFAGAIYDPAIALLEQAGSAIGGEWTQPEQSPAIVNPRQGGGVNIDLGSGTGTIVQQRVVLSAGIWRFSVEQSGASAPALSWRLACDDIGPLEFELDNTKQAERGSWLVDVPDGCGPALLSLRKTSDREPGLQEIVLSRVALERIR